ncbi:hypothetical protein AWC29_28130 [Mycobacterium triplex]|uniref:Uncharacterized protein n=1 Tax=Mycobacterium triplex TaxID=47839 RepID=A0A024JWF8_9MYCO|nr:hypothetical protein [Mycobacterium triplex]ORW99601.1 hypothetical protein AWC29_28130 [Mycobacterium triplex]CDO87568.1 hypothetical protein BN973_01923 [Mycobacterium triplex]
MWRRARTCDHHAHDSCDSDKRHQPDESYQLRATDDIDEPREHNEPHDHHESCGHNEFHDADEFRNPGGAGRYRVTTSRIRLAAMIPVDRCERPCEKPLP